MLEHNTLLAGHQLAGSATLASAVRDRRVSVPSGGVSEKICSGNKEQATDGRRRDIEDAVVCARRIADKRPLKHPFDDRRVCGIGDVLGTELAGTDAPERHIVMHDIRLNAVCVDNRVDRYMGMRQVSALDILKLGATNNLLLLFDGHRVPAFQIMQILLNHHVAAVPKGRVLVTNERHRDRVRASQIRRPVHKPQQVAVVEVAESMNLINNVGGTSQPRGQQCG